MNPNNFNPLLTEPSPEPSSFSDGLHTILSVIGILISALVIAFGLSFYVFRTYQVDGPSMEPTLQHNDRLIIWKLPRTWANITSNPYIPNRGDIIVFTEQGFSASDASSKQLIKRVIGLPGDRVVIQNGTATIYNEEDPDGFRPDKTMPYGKELDLTISPEENVDEVVSEGQVFVMGDNRDNSLDSRAFGSISADTIVGKLILRIFPIQSMKVF